MFKMHIIIYSIKSSRYVKKCVTSNLLRIHTFGDMVMNGVKSSFSRMMFDQGRLVRIKQIVGREVP